MSMIAYLEGDIELLRPTYAVLKVGGVGYKVFVGPTFGDKLHENAFAKMFIYTQVREDISALYGFATVEELEFFELLISVSGIGPKAAMGILSAASVDKVRASIAAQDPTLLSSVSGVGKKTAEKVVIELKGKVGATGSLFDNSNGKAEDVYEALMQLGFKPVEAREAIAAMPEDCVGEENQLKYCLASLNRK
jgi:Holliday junction DNA helicase RuvA